MRRVGFKFKMQSPRVASLVLFEQANLSGKLIKIMVDESTLAGVIYLQSVYFCSDQRDDGEEIAFRKIKGHLFALTIHTPRSKQFCWGLGNTLQAACLASVGLSGAVTG